MKQHQIDLFNKILNRYSGDEVHSREQMVFDIGILMGIIVDLNRAIPPECISKTDPDNNGPMDAA